MQRGPVARSRPGSGLALFVVVVFTVFSCVPYDAPGDPAFDQRVRDSLGPGGGTIDQRQFPIRPEEEADPATPNDEDSTDSASDETNAEGEFTNNEEEPEPVPLSVAGLRAQVLETNLGLQVLRIDPEIAGAALDAERAKFDATFILRAGFSAEDKTLGNTSLFSVTSPTSGTPFSGAFTELAQDRDRFTGSFGVVQPLPTGGRISVEQAFEIDDKSAGPIVSTEDRSALRFSLSQPLLRGAGIEVNTASIRLAELGRSAVSAKTKLSAIRLLANAEKAYWRAYAAQRKLEVREEQFGIATDLQSFVRERIEAGVEQPIDQIGADLAVAQQLESLVVAQTLARIRQRELRRVLNRPDLRLRDDRKFELETEPTLLQFELEANDLVTQALANRMELLELELQLSADQLRINVAENATLPVFSLDFQYGIEQRGASLGSAFADQFDFEDQGFAIGLRGEIPVTNARARARLLEANLVRKRRLRTKALRELAIEQEVLDARDVIAQNWQRILAARQNVFASSRNLQAVRDQLTIGTRTIQDVAIALNLLGSARTREIDAIVDYQVSQIDLAFATGTILGYAGASVDPLPIGLGSQ
ncbi:MAG: TolC family protein [Planctomycetota bacterium]